MAPVEAEDPIKAVERRLSLVESENQSLRIELTDLRNRMYRWEEMAGDLVKRFMTMEKYEAMIEILQERDRLFRVVIKDVIDRIDQLWSQFR